MRLRKQYLEGDLQSARIVHFLLTKLKYQDIYEDDFDDIS